MVQGTMGKAGNCLASHVWKEDAFFGGPSFDGLFYFFGNASVRCTLMRDGIEGSRGVIMVKKWIVLPVIMAALFSLAACGYVPAEGIYVKTEPPKEAAAETPKENQEKGSKTVEELGDTLLLVTTTSTRDSGLFDAILEDFTVKTDVEVKVITVGTGKALQMGRDGEADVLLVHAKASEEEFVAEGYGTERFDVMYNDFVIVGPPEDPAGLKYGAVADVVAAMALIDAAGSQFLSRGDDSGTNKKEISLWESAEIAPEGKAYYVSTGKGMGDTLMMASEMQGYTITDRATYLNMKDKTELVILCEGDELLFNQYGVIPVNPDKSDLINHPEAIAFVEWLLSDGTQAMIGEYGVDRFGSPLFTPNAK